MSKKVFIGVGHGGTDSGAVKYGVDKNKSFGDGTLNAVNYLLGVWGYQQNGIAGENFIKRLHTEIENKVK
ncbi:hypothetical protein OCV67_12920 [Porcipelethomonas ammoniilytica]|uniref:hypothetical protein n=1 Tax=Porcipelethomonas ammoniilytica TaxID=2981722 RepID=UPI000820CE4C|nr:hypothetical protein [Porcipelethomonas ammoniilytica]MCU6720821.1 hypothetical protein [Porcipelethomonas ammoniilytica]SCJ26644.1 Uncharacterised protein [uncultured Ruminococcus sp.]